MMFTSKTLRKELKSIIGQCYYTDSYYQIEAFSVLTHHQDAPYCGVFHDAYHSLSLYLTSAFI